MLPPRNKHRDGHEAENRAATYLVGRGFVIVARNYRCKLGELDLVARDGDALVFVEVRSRADARHGSALEAVPPAKQRQVARVAQHYLASQRRPDGVRRVRFDVVGITGDQLEHVRDAFRVE